MRTRLATFGVISLLSFSALTACDYEFKDEPPPFETEEEAPPEEEVAPEEPEANEERPPEPPPVRPTLAPGKVVASTEVPPKDFKRLSIADLEAAGKVRIDCPAGKGDTPKMFDGNEETLVRTDGINPLKMSLTFVEPVKIKGVRVLSTYSDYNWSFTADNGERLVLESIPEGVSSVLVLPAPVTAKSITIEVLRRTRDDYVHVNEVDLYE